MRCSLSLLLLLASCSAKPEFKPPAMREPIGATEIRIDAAEQYRQFGIELPAPSKEFSEWATANRISFGIIPSGGKPRETVRSSSGMIVGVQSWIEPPSWYLTLGREQWKSGDYIHVCGRDFDLMEKAAMELVDKYQWSTQSDLCWEQGTDQKFSARKH